MHVDSTKQKRSIRRSFDICVLRGIIKENKMIKKLFKYSLIYILLASANLYALAPLDMLEDGKRAFDLCNWEESREILERFMETWPEHEKYSEALYFYTLASAKTIDKRTFDQEPHLALLASPNTKYYEDLLKDSKRVLKEKHLIAFEIGEDMEESMTNLTEKYYPNDEFCFQKDIYGKTRFLFIKHR